VRHHPAFKAECKASVQNDEIHRWWGGISLSCIHLTLHPHLPLIIRTHTLTDLDKKMEEKEKKRDGDLGSPESQQISCVVSLLSLFNLEHTLQE
jgi:hypothetical protein